MALLGKPSSRKGTAIDHAKKDSNRDRGCRPRDAPGRLRRSIGFGGPTVRPPSRKLALRSFSGNAGRRLKCQPKCCPPGRGNNGHDRISRQVLRGSTSERVARLHNGDAIFGADPQPAQRVLADGADQVVGQAVGFVIIPAYPSFVHRARQLVGARSGISVSVLKGIRTSRQAAVEVFAFSLPFLIQQQQAVARSIRYPGSSPSPLLAVMRFSAMPSAMTKQGDWPCSRK